MFANSTAAIHASQVNRALASQEVGGPQAPEDILVVSLRCKCYSLCDDVCSSRERASKGTEGRKGRVGSSLRVSRVLLESLQLPSEAVVPLQVNYRAGMPGAAERLSRTASFTLCLRCRRETIDVSDCRSDMTSRMRGHAMGGAHRSRRARTSVCDKPAFGE